MHSYYSLDGQYHVDELVAMAVEAGLDCISITDHNCVRANREAEEPCRQAGIRYVPGIEIDCSHKGRNFHVLGYFIDYDSEDFRKLEVHIVSQDRYVSGRILETVRNMGFDLNMEALLKLSEEMFFREIYPAEMIAEVLLNDSRYDDSEILKPYRKGGARGDNPNVNFYWDYFSQGQPGYTEVTYPPMRDIIAMIHGSGGLAVLAHPGQNLKEDREMVHDLIALGLDGLEVFSSYHSDEDIEYYYDAALSSDLLVTCGSDFHGRNKPQIEMGKIRYLHGWQESGIEEMERRLEHAGNRN